MKVKFLSIQRILAIVTLVYAIFYIWHTVDDGNSQLYISLIGTAALGLCALLVTIKKDPDVQLTAGLIGIGFGFQMIFSSISYIDFNNISVLGFVIAIVVMTAGLLCILFSFPVYCGNKYDTKRILVALLIYLLTLLLFVIIDVISNNANFFKTLTYYRPQLLFFIPVIFYIVLIYRYDIGYESATYRFKTNISIINDSLYSDHDTYVWRADLKKLDELQYHMTPMNKGHVRSELTLPMTTGGKKANLVVQEWDNGKYYVMIMRHRKGTLIQTLRFEGVNTIPDTGDIDTCTSFTMYGNEGFFIRILIKDEEIESKTTKRHKIICALVGVKNRY